MNDDSNENRDFSVSDRRTSTGTRPPEEKKGRESKPSGDSSRGGQGRAEPAPKVDFSTFLLSLLSTALIQLGDLADPMSGKVEKNLDAAGQTIDILDIIRDKTKGNLTEEEEKLLTNATAELKWKYLDALKQKG